MAGYLNFQTGQVLTAAQVNGFLMEQATMTFADDAARDAALAGVLREGLLTYNLDTNRLEVYDGTDWVEPAPEIAGIGSNVVQTVTTTQTTTSSTSFVNTSCTATITPTTATSKILVVVSVGELRNSTNTIGAILGVFRGDVTGTALNTAGSAQTFSNVVGSTVANAAFAYLDSPGTTSPTTYTLGLRGSTSSGDARVRGDQVMTLIEVAP